MQEYAQLQQYTQDNYNYTRQLQQYAQDNYNNTRKTCSGS